MSVLKCGRYRPYDFQLTGMRFGEAALAVNNGVGLFDDMGVGKTIQAGGIVYYHPEMCPVTVGSQVRSEISIRHVPWNVDGN